MVVSRFRRMSLCVGVGLALSLLIPNPASADPSPTPVSQSGLSDVEAMRQARASGKPVVATSLTDERTEVHPEPWRVSYAASRLRAVVS